jgi:plasmid stabilization system protein ParE
MYAIRWTLPAIRQLAELRQFIAENDSIAANDLAGDIMEKADTLRTLPYRGMRRGDGFRGLVIRRRYIVEYLVDEQTVYITGVLLGALQTKR